MSIKIRVCEICNQIKKLEQDFYMTTNKKSVTITYRKTCKECYQKKRKEYFKKYYNETIKKKKALRNKEKQC